MDSTDGLVPRQARARGGGSSGAETWEMKISGMKVTVDAVATTSCIEWDGAMEKPLQARWQTVQEAQAEEGLALSA